MKTLYILPLLSLILFQACNSRLFDSTEEKLVGKWRVEKVTIYEGFVSFGNDITDQYSDLELIFTANQNLQWNRDPAAVSYSGLYTVDKDSYVDHEGYTSYQEELHVFLESTTGETMAQEWAQLNVTGKKLTFSYKDDGGDRYRFRFRKL